MPRPRHRPPTSPTASTHPPSNGPHHYPRELKHHFPKTPTCRHCVCSFGAHLPHTGNCPRHRDCPGFYTPAAPATSGTSSATGHRITPDRV